MPRLERVRIELHRPLQRIERFRERAGISVQLPQQGKLVRVVGVVNAMAGVARGGQRLASQPAATVAHILLSVLVFIPELRIEVILASRFLLAPAARVRPRQAVTHAIVARQEFGRAFQPLRSCGHVA